jgi:hypothetical protein
MWHFFDGTYIQFLKSRASIYPTSPTSQTFPSPNSLKVIRLLRQKVSGTGLKNSMKLKESLRDTSSSEPYRIASIDTAEVASLYTEGAPHSQKISLSLSLWSCSQPVDRQLKWWWLTRYPMLIS